MPAIPVAHDRRLEQSLAPAANRKYRGKGGIRWLTIIYGERYQLGLSSSQNLSLGNSTPLTTALHPMDSFWPKYVLVWCSHPALSIQDIRLADIPLQGILVLESNDVILMAKAVHTLDCVPYYSFLRCRWQGFNSQQEQTHMNKRGYPRI